MDNKERLYVRAVNLIADIQKRTTNWSRTAELIEILSDLVPARNGGAAEYWAGSPDSRLLADAVIHKLKCPPVSDPVQASIVEMTAEWTQENSKLEEWRSKEKHRAR